MSLGWVMQQPRLKQCWVDGAQLAALVACVRRGAPPMLFAAQVFVLWPDDGSWYKGRVTECDVDNAKATIYYDETEETEECDLKELIGDGQIAFSEWRAAGDASGVPSAHLSSVPCSCKTSCHGAGCTLGPATSKAAARGSALPPPTTALSCRCLRPPAFWLCCWCRGAAPLRPQMQDRRDRAGCPLLRAGSSGGGSPAGGSFLGI